MASSEVKTNGSESKSENLYPTLSADTEDGLSELSSLCVNCYEQGVTKLLFVQIPFFREIILSSFSCPHCNYSNNFVQSAGAIQEKGISWTLKVTKVEDLNRQLLKTDTCTIIFPDLEFEIPAESQKGSLTNVEGVLQTAIEGLSQEQPIRRIMQPEVAEKLDCFIEKLKELLLVKEPFVMKLDDPTGNSFIENPFAPSADLNLDHSFYIRSLEQDKMLCLQVDESENNEYRNPNETLDLESEVLTFDANCSNCNAPCQTNMKTVKIPYFKEVIIMSTNCDACGDRSNEVKSGTGFEPKGKKITLKVENELDLNRDVLKSETCNVLIPELSLEHEGMAVSGKFTTVEGLLLDIKKALVDSNPFVGGDSSKSKNLLQVGEDLQDLADGKKPFTLILDDLNANSYIQDLYVPEPDPRLTIEEYERTFEQNETLGLNDMKTENYEQTR